MARPLLVSAFEPFGGSTTNASLEVLRRLSETEDFETLVLPVVRLEAQKPALERLGRSPQPRLYLALGEAGPDPVVRLEKVAVNWDDYALPDNGGNQPRDEAIVPGGPDAYFASIPVGPIVRSLEGRTPLPVVVSLSAGSFLCNHLAYAVSHHLAANRVCPFAFVHLPAWRSRRGGIFLDTITETVLSLIRAADRFTNPPTEG
ncbi:MAG: hypothetical protein SFU56_18865 [Capsulimonadales bacterium]|nr:hypothetical protein [Capsulimonadales bacterium]